MEILAIIPARGGSKGVPRKNIRSVGGRPLIAWMIAAAKDAKMVTRIVVSTDDPEIAAVAKEHGAEVPFMRPAELAQDLSTDIEYIFYTLDALKKREQYDPDIVIRLPPTSPLCRPEDIDRGIQTLVDTDGADAARPIMESPKHPYKMWKLEGISSFLVPFVDDKATGLREAYNLPRQLFPKVYVHTGAMDVIWVRTIREQQSTSGKKTAYFFMEPESSVNIDSNLDLEFAEFLLQRRKALDLNSQREESN